jgi:CRP-like cAMP-binding protein
MERAAVLKAVGNAFDGGLSPDAIDSLVEASSLRRLAMGERLFCAQDPVSDVFVVEFGEVSLLSETPEGGSLLHRVVGPAELLGEEGALTGLSYGWNAVSTLDSLLVSIPARRLVRLLERENVAALRADPKTGDVNRAVI